jgi:hypothetical protein
VATGVDGRSVGATAEPRVSASIGTHPGSGLGNPEATPELKQKIVDGVMAEAGSHSVDELAAERDAMLLGLLTVRATTSTPASRALRPGSPPRKGQRACEKGEVAMTDTQGKCSYSRRAMAVTCSR